MKGRRVKLKQSWMNTPAGAEMNLNQKVAQDLINYEVAEALEDAAKPEPQFLDVILKEEFLKTPAGAKMRYRYSVAQDLISRGVAELATKKKRARSPQNKAVQAAANK